MSEALRWPKKLYFLLLTTLLAPAIAALPLAAVSSAVELIGYFDGRNSAFSLSEIARRTGSFMLLGVAVGFIPGFIAGVAILRLRSRALRLNFVTIAFVVALLCLIFSALLYLLIGMPIIGPFTVLTGLFLPWMSVDAVLCGVFAAAFIWLFRRPLYIDDLIKSGRRPTVSQ